MGNCLVNLKDRIKSPVPRAILHDESPNRRDDISDLPHDINVEVRGLYDFEARDESELSFSRGDRMKILNKDVPNAPGWWMAKHLKTDCVGVIPSNFVKEWSQTDDLSCEPWWFDIDRRSATRQLILPANPRGTFLVRNSKEAEMYTLSVKNFGAAEEEIDVRHYHIKYDSQQSFYYINPNTKFSSLQELIAHYQSMAAGLCCNLTKPCPKEPQTIPFKDFQINRSDIKMIKKLGAGKFGEVWEGKYKQKFGVAVKKMLPGKESKEKFLDEAKVMHSVHHSRLIQLMGVVTEGEPILIIIEFVEKGNLLEYLKNDKGRKVVFGNILDIAAQIAEGMEYLEARNFIHRDLRAVNILVGKGNCIKIADFGLAKLLLGDAYDLSEDSKFPIKWSSPETILYRKFTIKSDVWSYGIVLFEIVTYGFTPYAGLTCYETIEKIKNRYTMPNPEHRNFPHIKCPPKMYKMMCQCWCFNPEERPTFEYLKNFFDNYYIETEKPYVLEECG